MWESVGLLLNAGFALQVYFFLISFIVVAGMVYPESAFPLSTKMDRYNDRYRDRGTHTYLV